MNKSDLTLELPNFEGPLDLLLHLIQSQKIDIYDIPIAQITSQYLEYLRQMQSLNLQIAGEYFMMSSTLLRIKSQYLLPQNDFVDEIEPEDDPRDELVQQLVQYSIFKRFLHISKNEMKKCRLLFLRKPVFQRLLKFNRCQRDKLPQMNWQQLFQWFCVD